jgi:hypothetical protein
MSRVPERIARFWRQLRLTDAVVFTLPVVVPMAYLVMASLLDYRQSQQFDDWWSNPASVSSAFSARAYAAAAAPVGASIKLGLDSEAVDPGVLRLEVEPQAWAAVQGDPLNGWDQWVDATLVRGIDRVDVELRKRGDTSVHYTTAKASFTLKLPRDALLAGGREIGVSGKTVLASWLANRLPEEFGVLAPRTAIAPVFINGRFYGVFRLVEIVDESFLRYAGRMPGNVFRADAAERGEYRKGVERSVFYNPYAWDRTAQTDSVPGEPVNAALMEMLAASNGSTFQDHRRALERVDRSQLAGVLAAALVAGDPYHMSSLHNQYWFEDPTTGLLFPVPWDLRLLPARERGGRLNDFLRDAIRDPLLVDAVLRRLAEQLEDGRLYDRMKQDVDEVWSRFGPHFRYDLLRRRAISDPGSPEEVLAQLRDNLDVLEERLADAGVKFVAGSAGDGTMILDFETAGWAGSELLELRLPDGAGEPRLIADRDLDGRPSAGDERIDVTVDRDPAGIRLRLREPLPLLSAWRPGEPRGVEPAAVRYRLFLVGSTPPLPGEPVPVLRNPYTGESSPVLPWDGGAEATARAWSAWQYEPTDSAADRNLSGAITLEQDLYVPETATLTIAAGTTIRLAPGVSIVSRGRILALGTPSAPIRLLPLVEGEPWGTLALQGPGADGSRFEHVTFREGSTARHERVTYKGMVTVHHARDVSFRQVRFERNLRSDDALNAVHSTISIVDSDFEDVNSDAVDFDYSAGEVRHSRFTGSRGDAIDLMTSSPLLVGNSMIGSGDKGISVGEASDPIVVDNQIMDGNRGIEVKDGSRPFIVHTLITGNNVGLLQRVKNWRYGSGGWATVAYTSIAGNGVDAEMDGRSQLTLLSSRIGRSIEISTSTVEDADSVISGASTRGPASPAPAIDDAQESAALPDDDPSGVAPDWLYASLGLDGDGRPGRLESGSTVRLTPPVARLDFREVLGGDLFGWEAAGGVERMDVREAELVAVADGRPGSIRRSVDWDLADDGSRYQAAVEVAAEGVERVRFELLDGSEVRAEATIQPREVPPLHRLVTLDLPPGRYTELRIEIDPRRDAQRVNEETGLLEVRSGRLRLGSLTVYGWRANGEVSR